MAPSEVGITRWVAGTSPIGSTDLVEAGSHLCHLAGLHAKLISVTDTSNVTLLRSPSDCLLQGLAGHSATGRIAFSEKKLRPEIFIADAATATVQMTLTRQADGPVVGYQAMAFSPDGRYLATVDDAPSFKLCLWDCGSGTVIAESDLPHSTSYRVGFHPTSNEDFLVYNGPVALLWNLENCRDLRTLVSTEVVLPGTENRPRSGMRRASVERNLSIKVDAREEVPAEVACHSWTEAEGLVLGCKRGEVLAVDTELGTSTISVHAYAYNEGAMDALVLAGPQFLAAGSAGILRRFSTSFQLLEELVLDQPVALLAQAGEQLLCLGPTAMLLLSPAGDSFSVTTLSHYASSALLGLAEMNVDDTEALVTVSKDGLVSMHGVKDNRCVGSGVLDVQDATCVAFASSTNRLCVGGSDGSVALALLADGAINTTHSLQLHASPVESVTFDHDNNRLFSVADGQLVAVQLGTQTPVVAIADLDAENLSAKDISVSAVDGDSLVNVLLHGPTDGDRVVHVRVPKSLSKLHFTVEVPLQLKPELVKQTTVPQAGEGIVVVGQRVLVTAGQSKQLLAIENGSVQAQTRHTVAGPAVISNAGEAVVTGGKDGKLLVGLGDDTQALRTHSPLDGGITNVALSADGTRVYTCGNSGVLECLDLLQTARAVPPVNDLASLSTTARARTRPATGALRAQPKKTLVDEALRTVVEGKSEFASQQDALRDNISQLRTKLQAMIASNESKPELEQLKRQEFALDLGLRDEVAKQREASIAELREEIEYEILAHLYLRNNIKQECWNSMTNVATTVYSLKNPLEVSNYPMRKRSAAELAEYKRVLTQRKIEKAETEALRRLNLLDVHVEEEDETTEHEKDPSAANPANGTAADEEPEELVEADEEEVDEEAEEEAEANRILYTPQELTTLLRKRNQIILLTNEIFERKAQFNKEFEEVLTSKKQVIEKIKEKNARVLKICKELKITQELFEPRLATLEEPEQLLEVKDEEVTVERILTEEELAAKAEADRLEAERLAAQMQDNPRERGINDMMHGRLEGKAEDDVWKDIPKPAFMDEVPSADYDDEQKVVADKYKADLAEPMELRDKRRKALNGELAKLLESIEADCIGFDERVQELFEFKIDTEQNVTAEELRVMKLEQTIHQHQASLHREREILEQITSINQERRNGQSAIQRAKELVDECQAEYEKMQAADKHLERSFKQRREFADQEAFIDILFKLYRRRPKRRAEVYDVPPLDKDLDCPEGLEDAVWNKLVQAREQKIESERGVRAKAAEVAELNGFYQRRATLGAELDDQIHGFMDELSNLRDERTRRALDVQVLIELKQGQVEVSNSNDFNPEFENALLLHDEVIHNINGNIKKLAGHKIEHLKRKVRSRKGIHSEQWEQERLDMGKEDLQQLIKDIQLFRVTKKMVSNTNLTEEQRRFREVEKLQQSLQVTKKAHSKAKQKKLETIRQLRRKINKKSASSESLDGSRTTLLTRVNERATVHRVQEATSPAGASKQSLTAVTKRRQLVDIVKSQNEDIALLRAEVDRLRMRSFPAFN